VREGYVCDEDETRENAFVKETQAGTRYLHPNDFTERMLERES